MSQRLSRRQFGLVSLMAMATGSLCFPGDEPPDDEDFIAFGDDDDFAALMKDGWELGGSFDEEDSVFGHPWLLDFVSVRKGNQNIILTHDPEFVNRWIDAHDECVATPPRDKDGRTRVFRRHLYGETS